MIRLADAPALAVAFWRCALGVAVLLPLALIRRERFPKGKALYVGVASGVACGLLLAGADAPAGRAVRQNCHFPSVATLGECQNH